MATKTGGELGGLAVITLAGGARLGRVHDVVFHALSGRVVGFLVDTGGLLAKPRFLPAGQVQSVGADALTVANADVLADASQVQADPDTLEARALAGRAVMSEAGTALGTVKDVLVETDALVVPSLVIATSFIDNALHGRPTLPLSLVRTVGKDSLVVPNSYDPKAAENSAP